MPLPPKVPRRRSQKRGSGGSRSDGPVDRGLGGAEKRGAGGGKAGEAGRDAAGGADGSSISSEETGPVVAEAHGKGADASASSVSSVSPPPAPFVGAAVEPRWQADGAASELSASLGRGTAAHTGGGSAVGGSAVSVWVATCEAGASLEAAAGLSSLRSTHLVGVGVVGVVGVEGGVGAGVEVGVGAGVEVRVRVTVGCPPLHGVADGRHAVGRQLAEP